MRIPLWTKLFLTFTALSVAGLTVLTLVQKRTFQRDFLDYVNQQATARIELAAQELGRRYEGAGSWRFLAENPRLFEAILDGNRATLDDDAFAPAMPGPRPDDPRFDDRKRGPPPRGDRLAPPDRGARDGPPPPGEERIDDRPPPKRGPRGDRRPPQKRIDALNIQTRVALLNDNDRIVVGNPAVPVDSPATPIVVDGRKVGRLLLAPQPALENDLDVAFVRSQARHALFAAIGVLVAALLAALVLARWLLAPVKTLSRRMQQLAAGDYHERILTTRNDELGELARNYNRLADTLAANQESRRSWGADIAHELRTPLSILRGEIQAMQDDVRPLSKQGLNSLQAECGRLTTLVEDLYQLALSDAGALVYRFETCDLNRLVRDAVGDGVRSLEDAGLAVTTVLAAGVLPVRVDPQRLAQLLANLLANSRRYTDAPGAVHISTERINGRALLHIDDSPPSVPAASLPKLFDRLYRVESSRRRVAADAAVGAGLGLSICKNIAEAHGATLTADTSPLGGLRITMSLQIAGNGQ